MRALEAINALRRGGWLATLTKNELVVMISYLCRADGNTGICWASDEELATELGHARTNHVQAARKMLREIHHLLERVADSGRASETYRVCLSPRERTADVVR